MFYTFNIASETFSTYLSGSSWELKDSVRSCACVGKLTLHVPSVSESVCV